ncbi:MAG TPA: hypothetical protein VN961_10080, partial [Streptosporangiaceae bacterium]|nr:hypothetical protein [Streptosporangiaceae bacterium]
ARIHHAGSLADDAGLAFTLGLTALPKATHLGTYSWRIRRDCNQKLLAGLVAALRPLGLATGEDGFNCDFHAIRHHGTEAVLEKHYVPRRSQRTRAVLTFFAQDHASSEMVYANADITKAEQAAEIINFADYWQQATGTDPGLLVFDSQLTTYKILEQLTGRGIAWLTLRQRGKNELARLAALPKTTHLGTYSWRVRRDSNQKLLTGLVKALRPLGLATGEEGFNCDFHAIRHHGDQAVLEKHYVPRRSQRTRAVLTFFAQDHATSDMVYSNADITKAEQAAEIIAFADYWQQATGAEPGMLVFDSQLTTYKILGQLTGRGIAWLTPRQRGKNELERLAALPASAWKTATIARAGRYRRPRLHEDMIKLTDISARVRQIAIKNIGRDEPALLISNDLTTPGKNLFARYAERMMVENELDAYIGGFHLDALTSGVPLNVDLDTTLTVIAGNLYRLLALKLSRYENATPDRIWRHFLDATGTLHITSDAVTCALNLRSHHPVLIDAGIADLEVPIPWWDGR